MLAKLQKEPFKYTIANLKKILDTQPIEKEQDQIKRTLKALTQIANLNQFLTILLDYHWFNRLCSIFEKLTLLFANLSQKQQNLQSHQNLPGSPLKTFDKNRQILLKGTKKIDLTPSTKKSRVITAPSVKILLQDLVQGLQKFDQIKHNSKRIKLLIQEMYEELNIQEDGEEDSKDDIHIENAWRKLYETNVNKFQNDPDFFLGSDKVQYLKQLLQQIQTIYKFMEVIKTTTLEIFTLIQQKSMDQIDNESRDLQNMDAVTKKSNNPSEQKSLLTEMLRDSSQRSNFEIQENEYSSQIIVRPRFKEYSQKQDLAYLDEQYKLSSKSAKPFGGMSHKLIRSEMNYGGGDQNAESKFRVRKKQVKIRRSEMGCSQCQIF